MMEFVFKLDLTTWEWWQVALTACVIILMFRGKYKEVFLWFQSFLPKLPRKNDNSNGE